MRVGLDPRRGFSTSRTEVRGPSERCGQDAGRGGCRALVAVRTVRVPEIQERPCGVISLSTRVPHVLHHKEGSIHNSRQESQGSRNLQNDVTAVPDTRM
jgi:hypothetical protein